MYSFTMYSILVLLELIVYIYYLGCILIVESVENEKEEDKIEFLNHSISKMHRYPRNHIRGQNKFHPYDKANSNMELFLCNTESIINISDSKQSVWSYICTDYIVSDNDQPNSTLLNYEKEVPCQKNETTEITGCSTISNNAIGIIKNDKTEENEEEYFKDTDFDICENVLNNVMKDVFDSSNILSLYKYAKDLIDYIDKEDNRSFFEKLNTENNTNEKTMMYNVEREIICNETFNKESYDSSSPINTYSTFIETNESKNLVNNKCNVEHEDGNKNKDDIEKKDEETILLGSSQAELSTKNTYLLKFAIIAEQLEVFHMIIKETNIENESELEKSILNIITNKSITDTDIGFIVSTDNLNVANNPMYSFYKIIEDIGEISMSSQVTSDPLMILDSIICTKIYLQLLLHFSRKNVRNQRTCLQNFCVKKKSVFARWGENGEHLPHDLFTLRNIFLNLQIKYRGPNLYKLRVFFKIVLQIIEPSNNGNDGTMISLYPNLIDEVNQIMQELDVDFKVILKSNSVDIGELIFLVSKYEEHGPLKKTCDLLKSVKEKKTEVKQIINNSFDKSEVGLLYIFYHLSFLMLHRFVNIHQKKDDIKDCANVYKIFIETFHKLLSKKKPLSSINDLNWEITRMIYCDQNLLHYIITYLCLNCVEIILVNVKDTFKKYSNELINYRNQGIVTIKIIKFGKVMKLYNTIVSSIKALNNILEAIDKRRFIVTKYLKLCSMEKTINSKITKLFSKFIIEEFSATATDAEHSLIVKTYQEIYSMYSEYFHIIDNELII